LSGQPKWQPKINIAGKNLFLQIPVELIMPLVGFTTAPVTIDFGSTANMFISFTNADLLLLPKS
jgi:hypothetical protein